jgi:hypothetical protein
MAIEATADGLAVVAGILLTLVFSYVPGLNAKFAGLDTERQRLVMLAALVAAAVLIGGLSCVGWLRTVSCDAAGWRAVGEALFWAIVANQGIYSISPRAKAVRAARAARG